MQCLHHGALLPFGQELESIDSLAPPLIETATSIGFQIRHDTFEYIIPRDERSYRYEY